MTASVMKWRMRFLGSVQTVDILWLKPGKIFEQYRVMYSPERPTVTGAGTLLSLKLRVC